MIEALIGLGANAGPVAETIQAAIDELAQVPGWRLKVASSLRPTQAVTLTNAPSGAYLNAAAHFECEASPAEILCRLQAVERRHGRVRDQRWGSRTLDLDLLFLDELAVETDDLIVPHPAAWYRRFVLDPLVEISPEFVHPVKRVRIRDLRQRLDRLPLSIALAGGDGRRRDDLAASAPRDGRLSVGEFNESDPEPVFLLWCGEPEDPEYQRLPPLPRVLPWPPGTPLDVFLNVLAASALG